MTKHYELPQKRKVAEMAIAHKLSGGAYSDIADVVGCHHTMIGKWVEAYQSGKLELPKPDPKEVKLEALEQIDIRPELKEIAKELKIGNESSRALTEGLVKVCMRLDSIYKKNSEEHENFDSIMSKVLNKVPANSDGS